MRCARGLKITCSVGLAALLAGCGLGYKNEGRERRPEYATGMGATIIYPGQAGPGMPGYAGGPAGSGSSSTSSGPGTQSGSASASGTPGPGGNMTMIGGASGESSESLSEKQFPVPGVLLGYPFWIFGKSLGSKADRAAEDRESPQTQAAPDGTQRPLTADDLERQRVVAENARLKEELMRQTRERNPARRGENRLSIGDELAALQNDLEARRAAPVAPRVEPPGRPARVPPLSAPDTADRDGDGQVDSWTYREHGRRVRELLDDDRDGRPDRTLYYDAEERIARSEEDLDGDGAYETVTLFDAEGRIARRRADTDGDGQSDAWSFYRDGDLVRNESDRDGDGFRDLILIYRGGKLVQEEEDRNGDGRPDTVSVYRDGDLVEKREDLDFDGKPDVESFYEKGRLVRRNLTSEQVFEKWTPGDGA